MNTQGYSFIRHAVAKAALLCVGLYSSASLAGDYTCAVPGDERHVRLDIPGKAHLCEVSVTAANAERRVLWYADNNTLFCSEKIVELVSKYTDQWGFNCSQWPVDDALTLLSDEQRRQLDRNLQQRRARADGGPTAMKVALSATDAEGNALIAVQWFGDNARADALSVFLDRGESNSNWDTLAYVENLTRLIDADGREVKRVLADSIDTSGALVLSTVLESTDQPGDAPSCRGEQRFLINQTGTLDALTPHIFACDS